MTTETDKTALALRFAMAITAQADMAESIEAPQFPPPNLTIAEALALASILREYAESGWKPIETAPQDGTRILATGGGLGGDVEMVSYLERIGAWESDQYILDDRDDESEGYNRPTHWMPLPAPPAEDGK